MAKPQAVLENIFRVAGKNKVVLALPEADDIRVATAAIKLKQDGLVCPLLITNQSSHRQALEHLQQQECAYNELAIDDLSNDAEQLKEDISLPVLCIKAGDNSYYNELIKQAGISTDKVTKDNPLHIASLLLRSGLIDAVLAGVATASSDVIRSGLKIVGLAPGVKTLSSCFLMLGETYSLTFADCAIVPKPTSQQLADIAFSAATMHRQLCDTTPKVALLSFSTHGSAKHPEVKQVQEAVKIINSRNPDFEVDGELQFDAALDTTVAQQKIFTSGSTVAGSANVFVFPDLNSGNIGYKIAERLGGMTAIGPLIMGLNAPLMDLSRGAEVEDIVVVAAIIAVLKNKSTNA